MMTLMLIYLFIIEYQPWDSMGRIPKGSEMYAETRNVQF